MNIMPWRMVRILNHALDQSTCKNCVLYKISMEAPIKLNYRGGIYFHFNQKVLHALRKVMHTLTDLIAIAAFPVCTSCCIIGVICNLLRWRNK